MDFKQNSPSEELFYLSDDSGEQMAFHFLDLILYEDREYIVLLPAEGPYTDEVVILQRERNSRGEDEGYGDVEDPAALQAVYGIFQEHFQDKFIFGD